VIRKFDLMVTLYIFGVITAELMGAKTFSLGRLGSVGLNASVAIFVMPMLFMVTDAVVEVYGRARAQSIVWCGLLTAALLIVFTTLATHLPPSKVFASSESGYDQVFASSARIAAASLAAFAVSQLLDVVLFAKLRQLMKGRSLWLRGNLANFAAQFADSAVFLVLAFYSLANGFTANIVFLASLLLPYWLLRCTLSVIETPLVYVAVDWLRRPEGGEEK
jgi:uncharacterized integral membrane protein (TIGR00697 family)